MSLANLGAAYQESLDAKGRAEIRARMAEEQIDDFSRLLGQWFLDSDQGAREWLIEVAKAYREEQQSKRQPCAT